MADAVTAEHADAGEPTGGAKRRQRRPKSGNTDLFNDLLSAANQLSVAERTRLVKSLAGQLGLLTVGGQTLIGGSASAEPSKKGKGKGNSEEKPPVRPNPLKGTKFWADKEAAKAAMLKAREDAGGAQLPPNHPAVTAYAIALKAYKDEQSKLKPVETAKQDQPQPVPSKKRAAKRRADKSPVRNEVTPKAGLLASASSIVKRMSGTATRSQAQASDMEVEKH